MSQVEEDLNESNVTARNKTQDEIKTNSSYFRHQQPENQDSNNPLKTKERLTQLMKNVHLTQQEQEEQEITPDSSIRSSDLSSDQENENISPKIMVTPCRLSFIKRPLNDSNIKLSSMTLSVKLSNDNHTPHSYYEEAIIIKDMKFKKSAIQYLFTKNIDCDYQPSSPQAVARSRNTSQQKSQIKTQLFSPIPSPKQSAKVDFAKPGNYALLAFEQILSDKRKEKLVQSIKRSRTLGKEEETEEYKEKAKTEEKEQQNKQENQEKVKEESEKKEEDQEEQKENKENKQEENKEDLEECEPTQNKKKFMQLAAKAKDQFQKQQQEDSQKFEDVEKIMKVSTPRKLMKKNHVSFRSMSTQDLRMNKIKEIQQRMKRKVVDVIMKFDYILEEDEEQRNVVYIDDQGVKRKRLSQKSKKKLKMYCIGCVGGFLVLVIIFMMAYIEVCYKIGNKESQDEL